MFAIDTFAVTALSSVFLMIACIAYSLISKDGNSFKEALSITIESDNGNPHYTALVWFISRQSYELTHGSFRLKSLNQSISSNELELF